MAYKKKNNQKKTEETFESLLSMVQEEAEKLHESRESEAEEFAPLEVVTKKSLGVDESIPAKYRKFNQVKGN